MAPRRFMLRIVSIHHEFGGEGWAAPCSLATVSRPALVGVPHLRRCRQSSATAVMLCCRPSSGACSGMTPCGLCTRSACGGGTSSTGGRLGSEFMIRQALLHRCDRDFAMKEELYVPEASV